MNTDTLNNNDTQEKNQKNFKSRKPHFFKGEFQDLVKVPLQDGGAVYTDLALMLNPEFVAASWSIDKRGTVEATIRGKKVRLRDMVTGRIPGDHSRVRQIVAGNDYTSWNLRVSPFPRKRRPITDLPDGTSLIRLRSGDNPPTAIVDTSWLNERPERRDYSYTVNSYGRGKETGYPIANGPGVESVNLHTLVLTKDEIPSELKGESDLQRDHINRNRLDARRSNLRWVTRSTNQKNRKGTNRHGLPWGVRGRNGDGFIVTLIGDGERRFNTPAFDRSGDAVIARELIARALDTGYANQLKMDQERLERIALKNKIPSYLITHKTASLSKQPRIMDYLSKLVKGRD